MTCDINLAIEMKKLADSMHGLREAIKRQENQLTSFDQNGGFQDIQLIPNRSFSEDRNISEEDLQLGLNLHGTDSEISQASHWCCSIDSISSSIGELKSALKTQDKLTIRIQTENEELKKQIKKKDKEIKKQKFLLRSERELFEQYKKDTCNDVRKYKSEESTGATEYMSKTSREIVKLKSELTHFKQLNAELEHKLNHLSKQVTNYKEENINLKSKIMQQEKRYNKFILEMSQRFEISRKQMELIASKKFENYPPRAMNLVLYKLTDRNTRLAYDNSMLKYELDKLKKHVIENSVAATMEKTGCLDNMPNKKPNTNSMENTSVTDYQGIRETRRALRNKNNQKRSEPNKTVNKYQDELTPQDRTFIWNQEEAETEIENQDSKKMEDSQWDCNSRSSGSTQLVRTASAPDLTSIRDAF